MVTGRRHTGRPLGRPVKAFPILLPVSLTPCRSSAFRWPAGRELGVAASAPRSRANDVGVFDDPLTCLTAR